jgi:hypothetical protein
MRSEYSKRPGIGNTVTEASKLTPGRRLSKLEEGAFRDEKLDEEKQFSSIEGSSFPWSALRV